MLAGAIPCRRHRHMRLGHNDISTHPFARRRQRPMFAH
ncbi:hypothetical protein ALSL_0632 [Aerosticca soli]|uniref:Uncharacterized protein n=1 Tax=Aerosticca soli TaxID=2010829 RepID=A0A2Z6E452_9GAMM|nr:hypothetical protein ALSL_0632 [Aerosticca soli]